MPSGGLGSDRTASAPADFALRIIGEKSLEPGAYSSFATTSYVRAWTSLFQSSRSSAPQSVFSMNIATLVGLGERLSIMPNVLLARSGDFGKGEKRYFSPRWWT